MKTGMKWLGFLVSFLMLLFGLAGATVYALSSARMNQTYEIDAAGVTIPTDELMLVRGKHVATVRGCTDCHTSDLSGGTLLDEPPVAQLNAPNLTSGSGGIGSQYSDADWVRAIRHGVGPDGKPLLFMPSHEFYFLSDVDLGALIAYLKTVPPVDNQPSDSSVGPIGRALFLAGQLDLIPAEKIDHTGQRPVAPEPGVTLAYGEYMAVGCIGCHGTGFSGGTIPGVPPEWPAAANLTPGGNLANWSEQAFIDTLRSGFTPEGKQLNPQYMPWPTYSQMTDEELKALWLYLQSLPVTEGENR